MAEEVSSKTESIEINKFLLDIKEQYRLLVQTSNEGVFIADSDGSIVFANQKMADMVGYSLEGTLGKKYFDIFHDQNGKSIRTKAECNAAIIERFDVTFSGTEGEDQWAIFSATPVIDKNNRYIGLLAMVMDITERKRIENVRSRLASIVDSSDDAIISERPGRRDPELERRRDEIIRL